MSQRNRTSYRSTPLVEMALLTLLLIAVGCAGAAKSSGAPGAAAAARPEEAFAGTWQGPFSADIGDGDITLVLDWDGENWTGEVTISMQGEAMFAPVSGMKIEGNSCTFTGYMAEMNLLFAARLEEDHLKGSIAAYVGDEEVGMATFVLAKK